AGISGATRATVGNGAVLHARSLLLDAAATTALSSEETSVGVGLISGAQADTQVTDTHAVAATVGESAVIDTVADVQLVATSTSGANVNVVLGTGGLGAGVGSNAVAVLIPQVSASIGRGT